MDNKPNDLLLRAGTFLICAFMAIFAIGIVLIALGFGAFLAWQTGLLGPIPDTATGLDPAHTPQLPLAMLLACGATVMAFYFALLLLRIIRSVGEGDPFSSENADRLHKMACIALAYQVVSAGLFLLGITVARITPFEALVSGEDLSLSALLLSFVLFILARVFQHGAEMREDLEGTV